MIHRLDSKIMLNMIYLKKTLLTMLKLIVPDTEKSKNNRKNNQKDARGFSHFRNRRGAMRNIDLIPDYLFKRISYFSEVYFRTFILISVILITAVFGRVPTRGMQTG